MKRLMVLLARLMAVLGALVLVALIVMTSVSILGRIGNGIAHAAWLNNTWPEFGAWLKALGIKPVTGDFELVEAGIAFAIFAFLPWCQIVQGHATVDLLANGFSPRNNRLLLLIWEVVFAAVMLLIAWRLFAGMSDKMRYGETTFLLQFPIWWTYLASFVACAIAAMTTLYTVYLRYRELVTGVLQFAAQQGTDH